MILEYLKMSWETYRRNIMSFVIAELLSLIIAGIFAFIGIAMIYGSIGVANLMDLSNPEIVITNIVSIFPFLFELGVTLLFFIISGIVFAFLQTGIYGMAVESFRGPAKYQTMFSIAKKSGFKGIISSVIIGVIAFILFFALIIGINIALPMIGGIIGMIIFFLIMVFFSLATPGIVVDDLDSINAISVSFNTIKKNYLETVKLLLLYAAMSLVVAIPYAGLIIYFFVVAPMIKVGLVFFYKRKKI